MRAKKGASTKAVLLLLAVVLLIGCTVGSTLAWLVTKTGPVTNTFTAGNINISLSESGNLNLKMVPGTDITKDPKVTVTGGSEACWLFVKVEEEAVSGYLTYTIAAGWTDLGNGVYYREVAASVADQSFDVLTDNKVSVPDTVTKAMMDAVDKGGIVPTLTFTAYAVQKSGFATADTAWDEAENLD